MTDEYEQLAEFHKERQQQTGQDPWAELRRRALAATPGPWYAHNPDDWMSMNALCISASPREPWIEDHEDAEEVIAMTLYQAGPLARHPQYEENTAYLQLADPTTILRLLKERDEGLARISILTNQRDLWQKDASVLNSVLHKANRVIADLIKEQNSLKAEADRLNALLRSNGAAHGD